MARRILIVAHPGALGIELLGVRDILEMANWYARQTGNPEPFAVEYATHDGEPIRLWAGLELSPMRNLTRIRAAVDTLIVVGGPFADTAAEIPALVDGVRRLAGKAGRVVGVCTGAFILAAAGLLDGQLCTTHWAYGDALAARHPLAQVDMEPMYVAGAEVWTSAGVTSGFDMLLALVEQDAGVEAALYVAQMLVLYLRRTGNQSQFHSPAPARVAHRGPVRELQQYIADNPGADLSLAALAHRLHMSPRHFARVFSEEVGVSAGRYVERVRLQAARRLLEECPDGTEAIAAAAGFGSYQSMRRAFVLALGISPAEYRRRFGAAQPPAPRQELARV